MQRLPQWLTFRKRKWKIQKLRQEQNHLNMPLLTEFNPVWDLVLQRCRAYGAGSCGASQRFAAAFWNGRVDILLYDSRQLSVMKETLWRQVAPGRFAPVEEKPAGRRILDRLPKLLQRVIDFIRSPKTHMAIAAFFIVASGFFFISQPIPTKPDSRGNQQTDISAFLCSLLNLLVFWICVAVVCRAASFIFGKRKIQTPDVDNSLKE